MALKMPTGATSATRSTNPTPDSAEVLDANNIATEGDNELSAEEIQGLKKQSHYQQLVKFVRDAYFQCKQSHTGIHQQWYMNMAFYKGDHYVENLRGTVTTRRAPSKAVRLTINRVEPMVRTEISMLTSQEPTAEVVPASTDDDDLLAAEVGKSVHEYITHQYKLKQKYVEAAFWQTVCGVGYIKTAWDKTKEGGLGGHTYSAPSPFHVMVPELLTIDIEEQPYVLNVFTKPIEWVRQKYGDKIPKEHKPTVVSTHEIMETQYMYLKNSDQRSEPDACLFIEAWIKPGTHPLLPNGGLITLVDSIIVSAHMDGMPYKHEEYPFTKFEGVPTGSYYSKSAVESFIQLQQELNRNRSQRTEARNLTSKPQWSAQEGSVDVSKWQNRPGQVLFYKPGMQPPTPMQLTPLPNYVIQEEENILRDMEDISGQHQVSRGTNPSGVTSGTAISFLQEADNSFRATTFMSVETGMEKIGKQSLVLAVQYWETARIVKVTGRDKTFSVKSLRGSDIAKGTDLRMERGSSLPVSAAARNALFLDLLNRGALDVDTAMELMKIPNMQAYFDRKNVDMYQAQRENQKMRELAAQADQLEEIHAKAEEMKQQTMMELGIVDPKMDPMGSQIEQIFEEPFIKVNDWDDHEIHLREVEFFMKGQTFETLPDPVKKEFEKHRNAHKNALELNMMQEMMKGGFQELQQMEAGGVDPNNPEGENQFSGIEQQEPIDAAQASV